MEDGGFSEGFVNSLENFSTKRVCMLDILEYPRVDKSLRLKETYPTKLWKIRKVIAGACIFISHRNI